MADQNPSSRPRGNPNWVPGGPSPNPRGRPRVGHALAERIRERLDPDAVIELALEVAADVTLPAERRLAALYGLADRGFTKPAVDTNISVNTSTTPQRDWSAVPLAERRELLARLQNVPTLDTSEAAGMTPACLEEESLR